MSLGLSQFRDYTLLTESLHYNPGPWTINQQFDILGSTLLCFLAESQMRRSTILSYLSVKYS